MSPPGFWDEQDHDIKTIGNEDPPVQHQSSSVKEFQEFRKHLCAMLASNPKGFTVQQLKTEWLNTFNEQIDVAISRSGFEKTNLIHLLTGHELEDIVDFDLNPVGKGYMFFGKSNPRIQHITEVINASAENNLEHMKRELFNSQQKGEQKNNRERLLRGKEMLFDIISNLGGHKDYIQFPLIQQAWAEKYKHALDETTLRKYFKKESLFSVFQMLLPEEVDIQSGSVKLRMSLQEAKLIWIKKMESEIKKEEKLERRQKIQESRLKLETTKKSQEPQLVPTLPSLPFAALKPPSYSPTQPSESRPASAYGEPPKRVLALQQAQNPKPIQVQQRPQSLVEVMKRNKNFEFLGDKENAHPKLETKENQVKQETPSWGHGSLGESGRFKTPEPKVKWTHPGDGDYTDDDDNVTLKDCSVSKPVPSSANPAQSRQIPSQNMKVTQPQKNSNPATFREFVPRVQKQNNCEEMNGFDENSPSFSRTHKDSQEQIDETQSELYQLHEKESCMARTTAASQQAELSRRQEKEAEAHREAELCRQREAHYQQQEAERQAQERLRIEEERRREESQRNIRAVEEERILQSSALKPRLRNNERRVFNQQTSAVYQKNNFLNEENGLSIGSISLKSQTPTRISDTTDRQHEDVLSYSSNVDTSNEIPQQQYRQHVLSRQSNSSHVQENQHQRYPKDKLPPLPEHDLYQCLDLAYPTQRPHETYIPSQGYPQNASYNRHMGCQGSNGYDLKRPQTHLSYHQPPVYDSRPTSRAYVPEQKYYEESIHGHHCGMDQREYMSSRAGYIRSESRASMASRATLRSHEPVHPRYDFMPTRMPLSYGHGSEQDQVKENFPVMNLNYMSYDLSDRWQRLAYLLTSNVVAKSTEIHRLNKILDAIIIVLGQEFLEPPNWSQFIREYCPELECHVKGANIYVGYKAHVSR